MTRAKHIKRSDKPWEKVQDELRPFGIHNQHQLVQAEADFRKALRASFEAAFQGHTSGDVLDSSINRQLFDATRTAFIRGDLKGLTVQLDFLFKSFLFRKNFTRNVNAVQRGFADMRYPWEWFPATRSLHRTIHLHVGPTNSGKTYHALKALENSKSGVYCGPLRLLAHEVYSRLEAKGKRCALMTGEEQRIPDDTDQYYVSCTVEMAPLNKLVDVAVVDEIQMIADSDRGGAWTGALLGLQAKELHLCGEERVVPLIKSICRTIGDEFIVHKYDRLTPLEAGNAAVGADLAGLQKGDCIVAFSRLALHGLKRAIEKKTGRRCAIIYGNLPPEIRTQQAALFNDPDNDYDFLVASDAIGMGLNLEIKRVIFDAIQKHDGFDWRNLTISEVRQIGGRAGRFKTARSEMIESAANNDKSATKDANDKIADPGSEDIRARNKDPKDGGSTGIVTTLDRRDLKHIKDNLWAEPPKIKHAVIIPPPAYVEQFAKTCPEGIPLSFVLLRMQETARVGEDFRLAIDAKIFDTADVLEPYDLSIYDRLVLLTSPANKRAAGGLDMIRAVARCVQDRAGGHLCDIPELRLEILEVDRAMVPEGQKAEYLHQLESLHQAVVLYLWVSYRFPVIFPSQNLAFHVRSMVQEKIEDCLNTLDYTEGQLSSRRDRARSAARQREQLEKGLGGKEDGKEGEKEEEHPGGPGRWNEEGHEEPLVEAPEELGWEEGFEGKDAGWVGLEKAKLDRETQSGSQRGRSNISLSRHA